MTVFRIAGLVLLAATAGAAPAGPSGLKPIEGFERVPVGGLVGAVTDFNDRPLWRASVVAEGRGGGRALKLAGIKSDNQTVWTMARNLNLARYGGICLHAKASRPVPDLDVMIQAGGRLLWQGAVGTEWTELRIPFDNPMGLGRFDPRRFEAISIRPIASAARPLEILVDDIAAYPVRQASGDLRAIFCGDAGWSTVPFSWIDDRTRKRSLGGLWAFDKGEGAYVCPIFTSSVSRMQGNVTGSISDSRIVATWFGYFTFSLAGYRGLLVDFRVDPATPVVVAVFWIAEEGGERWIALRDAPVRCEGIKVPFTEFAPDATWNLRVPEAGRNGRMDLDAMREWGIDLIPTSEEAFRGRFYIRSASVSRM